MKQTLLQKRILVLLSFILIIFLQDSFAGGPWVLGAGQSNLSLGYSRKVGKKRWSATITEPDGSTKLDKNYNNDVITYSLVDPHDSVTVDGKFHDFRYTYFQGQIGICKNLELDFTINWLNGLEAQRSDPYTGKLWTYYDSEGNMVIGENGTYHYAVWEKNHGFTDSWIGLKYQFLHGNWPMAIEVNTRFPDLYNEPTEVYTRFKTQFVSVTYNDVANDTSYTLKDTIIEPGSEWRGLLKRDLAFVIHSGHSFMDGKIYTQGFLGYNIRQGAFADQVMVGISGGYNWKINDMVTIIPNLSFDYIGGIGNGGQPDSTDRFNSVYKNYNFNNSKHFRMYANVDFMLNDRFDAKIGYGSWLWGKGEVKYTEMFFQLSYVIGCGDKNSQK